MSTGTKSKDSTHQKRRGALVTALAVTLTFGLLGLGLRAAFRSPQFLLRMVEVSDLPENSPVDAAGLTELAALPVDRISLFDVDLQAVEKRLLTHPWVRSARLWKRFPQTLSVEVELRKPKALIQLEGGAMSYLDEDGRVFGRVSLSQVPDLPVLTGLQTEGTQQILKSLRLLERWASHPLPRIATLGFDPERGYRAWVAYELVRGGRSEGKARVQVQLGQEIDGELDSQLEKLRAVFHYLKGNAIPARQVWADAGKKIVVKIARGS